MGYGTNNGVAASTVRTDGGLPLQLAFLAGCTTGGTPTCREPNIIVNDSARPQSERKVCVTIEPGSVRYGEGGAVEVATPTQDTHLWGVTCAAGGEIDLKHSFDSELRSCTLGADRQFSKHFLPTGTPVVFYPPPSLNQAPTLWSATLQSDGKFSGLPFPKETDVRVDKEGVLQETIFPVETVIQGVAVSAGARVRFDGSLIMSTSALATAEDADHLFSGIPCDKGKPAFFYPSREESVVLMSCTVAKVVEFGGRFLAEGSEVVLDRNESLDSGTLERPTTIAKIPVAAGYIDIRDLSRNGSPERFTLGARHTFPEGRFEAGTEIQTFGDSSALMWARIKVAHRLGGVSFGPGKLEFSAGKVSFGPLATRQTLGGVSLEKGTEVWLDENEQIWQARLIVKQTIEGFDVRPGERLSFEEGRLTAVLSPNSRVRLRRDPSGQLKDLAAEK